MKRHERFSLYRLIIQCTVVVMLLVGIGLTENHYNNPFRHCKQFQTDTEYKGYNCSNGTTLFVPPQH